MYQSLVNKKDKAFFTRLYRRKRNVCMGLIRLAPQIPICLLGWHTWQKPHEIFTRSKNKKMQIKLAIPKIKFLQIYNLWILQLNFILHRVVSVSRNKRFEKMHNKKVWITRRPDNYCLSKSLFQKCFDQIWDYFRIGRLIKNANTPIKIIYSFSEAKLHP